MAYPPAGAVRGGTSWGSAARGKVRGMVRGCASWLQTRCRAEPGQRSKEVTGGLMTLKQDRKGTLALHCSLPPPGLGQDADLSIQQEENTVDPSESSAQGAVKVTLTLGDSFSGSGSGSGLLSSGRHLLFSSTNGDRMPTYVPLGSSQVLTPCTLTILRRSTARRPILQRKGLRKKE